jgi:hypothetical protein
MGSTMITSVNSRNRQLIPGILQLNLRGRPEMVAVGFKQLTPPKVIATFRSLDPQRSERPSRKHRRQNAKGLPEPTTKRSLHFVTWLAIRASIMVPRYDSEVPSSKHLSTGLGTHVSTDAQDNLQSVHKILLIGPLQRPEICVLRQNLNGRPELITIRDYHILLSSDYHILLTSIFFNDRSETFTLGLLPTETNPGSKLADR